MHGKAAAHQAPHDQPVLLALINEARAIRWEDGQLESWASHGYTCAATTLGDSWKVLGWVMADGSLPMGELDSIDPDLAQFRWLTVPNFEPAVDRARTK